MSAALAPIVEKFASQPEMVSKIQAYAATSQVLTSADGLYMSLFVGIPLTNWLYKKFKKEKAAPAQKAVAGK
jgi:Na+/glutamate symporter